MHVAGEIEQKLLHLGGKLEPLSFCWPKKMRDTSINNNSFSDTKSIYFISSECPMWRRFCLISLAFCIREYWIIFRIKGDIHMFISSTKPFLSNKWLLRYSDFKLAGLFLTHPIYQTYLYCICRQNHNSTNNTKQFNVSWFDTKMTLHTTHQTKPTKPNLPNQSYQTKPTTPNSPNLIETKTNLDTHADSSVEDFLDNIK